MAALQSNCVKSSKTISCPDTATGQSSSLSPAKPGRQSSFHLTGLILAMSALQSLVGTAPETLRILRIDDFPTNQYNQRSEKQAPAEKVLDK